MTKEEIGQILKELRLACGKTQKEVAELLGRKQQIVGHWETGYSQPDANTLFILCDIYGTTVDAAFGFKKSNITISKKDIDLIQKYHALDPHGKEMVNIVLTKEHERVTSFKNKVTHIEDARSQYASPNAAHALLDATAEDIKHDEDIMDDENF